MSNSVTVTVRMDGSAGSSHNFDLGEDAAAPAPPDVSSGDDSGYDQVATAADAPPPAVDGGAYRATVASASEAPPPDYDGGDDGSGQNSDQDAADEGDSPPPPDA